MDGIIQIVFFFVLLAIGVFAGRANERRHDRELAEAEEALRDIAVSNGRAPGEAGTFSGGKLVVGSVVIAEDFFKRVASAPHVVNVRLETASLSEDWSGRRPMFSAEFIAYGAALVPIR